MLNVRKVKRTVTNTKSKEELIDEAMRDSEPYFQAIAEGAGKDSADRAREEYRHELEEELKDYQQSEEVEVTLIQID